MNIILEHLAPQATPLDAVILGTGYEIKFPLLPQDVVPVVDNDVQLYKYVFPPHLRHPTLAIIGLIQPDGSLLPIAEMQVRALFTGISSYTSWSVLMAKLRKRLTTYHSIR